MATREVLHSFFDFTRKYNHIYDIISSIYVLIDYTRKRNEPYFTFLNKQIDSMLKSGDFSTVVETTLANVMHDVSPEVIDWTIIAYIFYALDRIRAVAQIHMNSNEYEEFKMKTIEIVFTRLDQTYGEKLNEREWKIFCIAETLSTMKVKPTIKNSISNLMNVFVFGISVFILNKVFVKYQHSNICSKISGFPILNPSLSGETSGLYMLFWRLHSIVSRSLKMSIQSSSDKT